MAKTPGGFRAALLIGWAVLAVAGVLYARQKSIPTWAALPVLAAFLVEYPFYLVPAFPSVRERWTGYRLPLFLVVGAVAPYLIACLGAVPFRWMSLVLLAAFAAGLSLWYRVLPANPLTDVLFLATVMAIIVGKYFDAIYPAAPTKDLREGLILLAHLALNQTAVMALLLVRRVPDPGYSFLPTRAEWRIGGLHFIYFCAAGVPLAALLHATHLRTPAPLWADIATFFGFLWVGSLAEEFFFRGIVQQWVEDWTGKRTAALLITSVVFGLAHLPFRGFPNWRWAAVVAVLGFFCGRARNQAGSIRAGVVTHALVVTTWRAFFA
jgi:membrane protease YdiL (CAAX protease family)